MANTNSPQKDWYSILGASPTDDIQEMKQKYQKLILTFHPDKQRPGVSEREAEQHLQRFIDVDQAWKILSNEESRNKYNLQLRAHELKQSWPVDDHITLNDMNWDNDAECYTYSCRCGGEFILDKEEMQEAETVVCCDSCSLSIEVQKALLFISKFLFDNSIERILELSYCIKQLTFKLDSPSNFLSGRRVGPGRDSANPAPNRANQASERDKGRLEAAV
ncbi:dnaJ homolog subfamily C member 24-like isoform X2 [Xyrauchen texanus]|nr:dnaJ homolog subfamily C member 24-like isoform X2 [Xyrauchen texanus]